MCKCHTASIANKDTEKLGDRLAEFTGNELDDEVLMGGANEPRRNLQLSYMVHFPVVEIAPIA